MAAGSLLASSTHSEAFSTRRSAKSHSSHPSSPQAFRTMRQLTGLIAPPSSLSKVIPGSGLPDVFFPPSARVQSTHRSAALIGALADSNASWAGSAST